MDTQQFFFLQRTLLSIENILKEILIVQAKALANQEAIIGKTSKLSQLSTELSSLADELVKRERKQKQSLLNP